MYKDHNNAKNEIAIYIHWPFCESLCPYCDFNSYVNKQIDHIAWKKRYLEEILFYKSILQNYQIRSIFFGGGTPSLMQPNTVFEILNLINTISDIRNAEITLEANPTSFEVAKFQDFKLAGINRVSLGVQSFDDNNLKFLGRNHSSKMAIAAIENSAKIFSNYSFDLIYALPNQTLDDWKKELEFSVKFNSNHISLYQLTIEENTKFSAQYKAKKFYLPENNIANQMYLYTNKFLKKFDYNHYEISNYAKLGYESRHNLAYWEYLPYIGIGPGAHGRLHNKLKDIQEMKNLYTKINTSQNRNLNIINLLKENKNDLKDYINLSKQDTDLSKENTSFLNYDHDKIASIQAIYSIKSPKQWLNSAPFENNQIENLTKQDILQEICLMSLRIQKGINLEQIEEYNNIKLQNLIEKNLFIKYKEMLKYSKNKKYLQIKQKYRHISDYLIGKILECYRE
ncbi:MAG: radical SAM family heme chaperone HemW [Rickettsiales bacterium]